MAVRPRGKSWVADYYDALKKRRWKSFPSARAAKEFEAEQLLKRARSAQAQPTIHPDILLRDYLDLWLKDVAELVEHNTQDQYTWAVRKYLQPSDLAPFRVRDLTYQHCRAFMKGLRSIRNPAAELATKTKKHIAGVLHTALADAVHEYSLRTDNPASGLKRRMKRGAAADVVSRDPDAIRAFTRDELAIFLESARTHEPRHYPVFVVLSRTGMRPGEALALKRSDLDFHGQKLHVLRSWTRGRKNRPGVIKATKTGKTRTCDMSASLRDYLQIHERDQAAYWHRQDRARPDFLFTNVLGHLLSHDSLQKAFARALEQAGLANHSPYDLRHTFASLLLQSGASIKYVQEQLGHSDIRLTVHLYGRWLPASNPAALDVLDAPDKPLVAPATKNQPATTSLSN